MGLLISVVGFFLTVVLSGMAYFEHKATHDKMFLYLSAGAAFLVVGHLAEALETVYSFGELPVVAMSLVGYLIIIYGVYAQSKVYKIIR